MTSETKTSEDLLGRALLCISREGLAVDRIGTGGNCEALSVATCRGYEVLVTDFASEGRLYVCLRSTEHGDPIEEGQDVPLSRVVDVVCGFIAAALQRKDGKRWTTPTGAIVEEIDLPDTVEEEMKMRALRKTEGTR